MIHLVWTGRGFLVGAITFGSSLVANLVTNSATGSEAFWNTHKWPLAISLFVSALLCWFVGGFYQNRKARVLLDPETGEKIGLPNSHTFFFIPMMWWGPILAAIAGVLCALDFSK